MENFKSASVEAREPSALIGEYLKETQRPEPITPLLRSAAIKSHRVLAILDGDVPAANFSSEPGHLLKAKRFYEAAIAEATRITPAELAGASQTLATLSQKLKTAPDAVSRQDLLEQKKELFQVIHAGECAFGNMALWYLRQNKFNEATTKILQAAGLDEANARRLSGLSEGDIKELSKKIDPESFILNDSYFSSSLRSIEGKGIAIPVSLKNLAAQLRASADSGKNAESPRTVVPPEVSPERQTPQAAGGNADDSKARLPQDVPQLMAQALKLKDDPDPAKLAETKAAFEALFQAMEDPITIKSLKDSLAAQVSLLENGKSADGTGGALSEADRLELHKSNQEIIASLQAASQMRLVYAQYLSGKAIAGLSAAAMAEPAQTVKDGALNQNKAMSDSLTKAMVDADFLPADILKREQKNLTVSQGLIKSGDGQKIISNGLDQINGSDEVPSALDLSTTMRTKAAYLYLHQGIEPNAAGDGFVVRKAELGKVDELFKPDQAAVLLREADRRYKEVHGANASNTEVAMLLDVSAKLTTPELEKQVKASDWSLKSMAVDIGSLVGAVALDALAARFHVRLSPASLQSARIGLSSVGAFSVRRYFMGNDETLTDSLVHSAAISGGFQLGRLGAASIDRSLLRNVDSESLLKRFASTAGNDSTVKHFGERLLNVHPQQAAAFLKSPLAARPIAELTSGELKSFSSLSGPEGLKAMVSVERNLNASYRVATALEQRGVATVGQLKEQVAARLGSAKEVSALAEQAGLNSKMTMKEVLEQLGKAGNTRFDSAEKITSELAEINKTAQGAPTLDAFNKYLAKASPESELKRLFPKLAKAEPETSLVSLQAKSPEVFGGMTTSIRGRVRLSPALENIKALNNGVTAGLSPSPSLLTRIGQSSSDILFHNRSWSAPWKLNFTPETATTRQLTSMAKSSESASNYVGYMLGSTAFFSTAGVYDRLSRPAPLGSSPYTFSEALADANFGSRQPGVMDVATRFSDGIFVAPLTGQVSSVAGSLGSFLRPATLYKNASSLGGVLLNTGALFQLNNPFRPAMERGARVDLLKEAAEQPLEDAQPANSERTVDQENPLGFTVPPGGVK